MDEFSEYFSIKIGMEREFQKYDSYPDNLLPIDIMFSWRPSGLRYWIKSNGLPANSKEYLYKYPVNIHCADYEILLDNKILYNLVKENEDIVLRWNKTVLKHYQTKTAKKYIDYVEPYLEWFEDKEINYKKVVSLFDELFDEQTEIKARTENDKVNLIEFKPPSLGDKYKYLQRIIKKKQFYISKEITSIQQYQLILYLLIEYYIQTNPKNEKGDMNNPYNSAEKVYDENRDELPKTWEKVSTLRKYYQLGEKINCD